MRASGPVDPVAARSELDVLAAGEAGAEVVGEVRTQVPAEVEVVQGDGLAEDAVSQVHAGEDLRLDLLGGLDLDVRVAGQARTGGDELTDCLLYTSPSPRDRTRSRMPSSA